MEKKAPRVPVVGEQVFWRGNYFKVLEVGSNFCVIQYGSTRVTVEFNEIAFQPGTER